MDGRPSSGDVATDNYLSTASSMNFVRETPAEAAAAFAWSTMLVSILMVLRISPSSAPATSMSTNHAHDLRPAVAVPDDLALKDRENGPWGPGYSGVR